MRQVNDALEDLCIRIKDLSRKVPFYCLLNVFFLFFVFCDQTSYIDLKMTKFTDLIKHGREKSLKVVKESEVVIVDY